MLGLMPVVLRDVSSGGSEIRLWGELKRHSADDTSESRTLEEGRAMVPMGVDAEAESRSSLTELRGEMGGMMA